jgi:hypothetical protein
MELLKACCLPAQRVIASAFERTAQVAPWPKPQPEMFIVPSAPVESFQSNAG